VIQIEAKNILYFGRAVTLLFFLLLANAISQGNQSTAKSILFILFGINVYFLIFFPKKVLQEVNQNWLDKQFPTK